MSNENNNVVYPYQVNAIMPITGLSIGTIMVPSTVKLTKEDVSICLNKAPVFRRFGNGKLVRVSISTLDRLHNEEFMTPEEYEAFVDKQNNTRGKVTMVETKEEEPKKETVEIKVEPVVKEETVEEPAETTAQTENIVEEETTVENVNDEEISENVTEDNVNEETDDRKNYNRYNNKKKHNR